ncbi:MAG: serine/threonine-protein phosphatase [Gammaproteobacteria bacterium]
MSSSPEEQYLNKFFSETDTPAEGQYFRLPDAEAVLYLQRRPGKDSENEDSAGIYALRDGDTVLAIADGMGGMPAGSKASGIIVKQLSRVLSKSSRNSSEHREDILTGLEAANDEIQAMGVGAGSTVAVVEVSNNLLRSYHAGDSEILLVGQRGKVKLQTISHSPVGYGVESGLIDHKDAMYHNERHLISNFLGLPDMRIEMGPAVEIARYDTLLLASDGVFDNVHVDELVDLVRKGGLAQVSKALIQLVSERMGSDSDATPSKPDDVGFFLYRRSA